MIKAIVGLVLIFVPIYLIMVTIIQAILKNAGKDVKELLDLYGKKEFLLESFLGATVIVSPFLGLIVLFWK